jgi:subtilisin family serine protease
MMTGRLLTYRRACERTGARAVFRWVLPALAVVAATSICGVDKARAFAIGSTSFRPSMPSIRPSMPSVRNGLGGTGPGVGVRANTVSEGGYHGNHLLREGNGPSRNRPELGDIVPQRGRIVRAIGTDDDYVPSKRRHVRTLDSGPPVSGTGRSGVGGAGGGGVPLADERRYVPDEVVVELSGNPTDQTFTAIGARHRLNRLETQRIGLTDSTWVRWRIAGRRSVPAVIRALEADNAVRSAQPNYLFAVQQDKPDDAQKGEQPGAQPVEPPGVQPVEQAGDPAQYALAKLHLPEAQALARGDRVVVAVIDTEIDKTSLELAGAITGSFDALGVAAPMEAHGTGIAGIIAAHAKLLGAAPAVRILAIRAFGNGNGTTFTIMKGLDYAVAHDARVINMSFAGPSDPALTRALAAAHLKGRVLVAAVGNKGPKSPALFPAADPNVIAVTATDAKDRLFEGANRGDHVAIAAPGVDILVAAPGNVFKMSTGTSFASAYVAGVAALLAERKPDLTPDAVKNLLMSTAHDLGSKGRNPQFGAGLMDANQALLSIDGRPAAEMVQDATH